MTEHSMKPNPPELRRITKEFNLEVKSEAQENFTQAWTNLLESLVKTFKIIEILDWMEYWLSRIGRNKK